jgi:hypothetical protein
MPLYAQSGPVALNKQAYTIVLPQDLQSSPYPGILCDLGMVTWFGHMHHQGHAVRPDPSAMGTHPGSRKSPTSTCTCCVQGMFSICQHTRHHSKQ